jgi:hypothetical protein
MESWFIGLLMGAIPSFFFGIEAGKLIRKWETEIVTAVKTAKIEAYEEVLKVSSTRREIK